MTQHEKPQKSNGKPPATELSQDELDGVAGGRRNGSNKPLPFLGSTTPTTIWDTRDDGLIVDTSGITLESPPKKKPHRP